MIRMLQQDNRATKAVFALIIGATIVAMVVFLVPGIFSDDTTSTNGAVYATIKTPGFLGRFDEATSIKTDQVRRAAERQLQQSQLPEQYLSLVMDQAGTVEVERGVLEHEADRLGLAVSNEDLQRFFQTGPYASYFFPGGVFIGEDKYTNFIESEARMSVADFEKGEKSRLELQRLQALVTGGVTVSDSAVRAQYLQTGTKVKFDYALIALADIKNTINPSDADLQDFFKKNSARYATAVPETRKIAFFSFDASALPSGPAQVTDADVQAFYAGHQDQFKTQEQVKTRHILIPVAKGADAKTDAAAKAKAEDVLKQVKAGGNFAELAKKYSEDPGSKDSGGELPLIPTSGLDPAYAQAAMALSPGQTSPLVRSQFGYHIIQTEEKTLASVKPLDQVKSTIMTQLQTQKSAAAAQTFAGQLAAEAKKSGLEKTAAAHNLHVVTTDYLAKTGIVPSLSDSTALLSAAFDATKNADPETVSTGEGYAIFQVQDIKAAHAPDFADYKTHILDDYRTEKAPELLNAQLTRLSERAKALNDLHKAAAEMKLEVKSSDLVGRDAQVTGIGSLTGAASVVFTMPKGGISGPVNEGANGAVLELTDKQEPAPDEIAKNFDATKEKLLNQKRQEAFTVFATSLMDRYEKAGAIVYSRKKTDLPLGN